MGPAWLWEQNGQINELELAEFVHVISRAFAFAWVREYVIFN